MESMKSEGFTFDEHKTVDGDHGRIDARKYVMTSDIGWLQALCVRLDVASIELKNLQFDRAIERSHDHRIFTGI